MPFILLYWFFVFKTRLGTVIQQNRKLRREQNQYSQRKNCKTPDIYICLSTHTTPQLHSYVQRSQVVQRLTLIFFHPSIMLDHFLAKVLPLYSHYFLKWNIIVLLTFPYFISGDPKEGARLCWCYGRKCRGSVFYQRFKENK